MQKLLLILLMVFVQTVFSQVYHFDVMAKYGKKTDNVYNEFVLYNNSKDTTYYMLLFKSGTVYSTIIDLKNNKFHRFNVTENKSNNNYTFDFAINYSRRLNLQLHKNFVYDFEETLKDSLVTLKIYKNLKRKILFDIIKYKVKPNSSNFFSIYQNSIFHPYQIPMGLMPKNLIFTSATRTTKNGYVEDIELLESKSSIFDIFVTN